MIKIFKDGEPVNLVRIKPYKGNGDLLFRINDLTKLDLLNPKLDFKQMPADLAGYRSDMEDTISLIEELVKTPFVCKDSEKEPIIKTPETEQYPEQYKPACP